MIRFLKGFWPSVLVLLGILWLTLAPHPVGKVHVELFEGADKVIHACMMGALTAVLLFDFWRGGMAVSMKLRLLTGLGVVLFSIFDEWAQGRMDLGRTADINDFFADCAGILLALLIVPLILGRMKRPKP